MSGEPARIEITRRIEWIDTDAQGIYHWTTVFRLTEAAEAALPRRPTILSSTQIECARDLRGLSLFRVLFAIPEAGRQVRLMPVATQSSSSPVSFDGQSL